MGREEAAIAGLYSSYHDADSGRMSVPWLDRRATIRRRFRFGCRYTCMSCIRGCVRGRAEVLGLSNPIVDQFH